MGAVIVDLLLIKVDGSHLNLIRDHDGPPCGTAADARQAATGYALRAPPFAACRVLKDLHHFLGHERRLCLPMHTQYDNGTDQW
jgi:hypothetical protein